MAHARGIAAELPARAPKPERPVRFGAAFVAIRADGAVLLRRRPPKELLGGMLEAPGTDWATTSKKKEFSSALPKMSDALSQAPIAGAWRLAPGEVTHTFTHFHLRLNVYCADGVPLRTPAPSACQWMPRARLDDEALPTVMRKVLARAFSAEANDP
jgi:A/G-specific adenine glycosylase